MSLDVYLNISEAVLVERGSGIYIRENGSTKEISEEEWQRIHPGREPVRVIKNPEGKETTEVFSANITHNLAEMAHQANLYNAVWCSEEYFVTRASQLIPILRDGVLQLKNNPKKFKTFNPKNGWGNYEVLLEFLENYLVACMKYPNAEIKTSR